ncbi:MAG: ATP-binding protein [Magnetococcales bacterium]|nr:ATP-binding protein [Magnetococcales bacterium]
MDWRRLLPATLFIWIRSRVSKRQDNQEFGLNLPLLAEGMRKLALIWLLIQNGTLQSGSVLFWDEPEANLNPALMGKVVEIILELHRQGVQVFLTTHNDVLLKEFDLRMRPDDQIHYLSLFRDNSGAVAANSCDTHLGVDPNTISDTFKDQTGWGWGIVPPFPSGKTCGLGPEN